MLYLYINNLLKQHEFLILNANLIFSSFCLILGFLLQAIALTIFNCSF